MSLADKLKKNSKLDRTAMVEDAAQDILPAAPTVSPLLNIALQGSPTGGLEAGLLTIAGESKSFKTTLGCVLLAAWVKKYDATVLYYNSEGKPQYEVFKAAGIPLDKVVHTPIRNLEELKFDLHHQLQNIDKDDRVCILIDSMGNLASKKEAKDAETDNSVSDMGVRAKEVKSFWRLVTPYFYEHNIPVVGIQHVYDSMSMYGGKVVAGGQGGILSSDDIWVMGKRAEKDGKELIGHKFIININKSRTILEKSVIPIEVSFEDGVKTHAGLLDVALLVEYCVSPKKGWYQWVDQETGEILDGSFRRKDADDPEFWKDALADPKFTELIRHHYRYSEKGLFKKLEEIGNGDDE